MFSFNSDIALLDYANFVFSFVPTNLTHFFSPRFVGLEQNPTSVLEKGEKENMMLKPFHALEKRPKSLMVLDRISHLQ